MFHELDWSSLSLSTFFKKSSLQTHTTHFLESYMI